MLVLLSELLRFLQAATYMNTKMLSKITDETNSIQPKDIPVRRQTGGVLLPAAKPTHYRDDLLPQ